MKFFCDRTISLIVIGGIKCRNGNSNKPESHINLNAKISVSLSTSDSILEKRDKYLDPNESGISKYMLCRFFDNIEFARAFLNRGEIKVNNLEKLRNLETKRMDIKEGMASDMLLDFSELEKNRPLIMGLMPLPDIMYSDMDVQIKNIMVYCLSYINLAKHGYKSRDDLFKILKNNFESDRYAVIIVYLPEFLNLIKKLFNSAYSDSVYLGLVNYRERTPFDYLPFQKDDLFFRELVFQKDTLFANENEFRVACNVSKCQQPFDIKEIGSIKDIAFLVDLEKEEIILDVDILK